MGSEQTGDGRSIRDAVNRDRWLTVNADGSINITNPSGGTLTVAQQSVAALNVETVVSVDNTETQLLAANAGRIGAVIQNHGSSVLAIYFTASTTFGNAPIQLQQYDSWNAEQPNGVYTGVVYGIRASATENAGVVEE